MNIKPYISRVAALLFSICLITSCAERDLIPETVDRQTVSFRLAVPPAERIKVGSRGGEGVSELKKITVLVFDGMDEDAVMAQQPYRVSSWETVSNDDGLGGTQEVIAFTMGISRAFLSAGGMTYIILGNVDPDQLQDMEVDVTTVADFRRKVMSISEAVEGGIVMSGVCTHGDMFEAVGHQHVVTMSRSVAAISVNLNSKDEESGLTSRTPLEFNLYGAPSSLKMATGINDTSSLPTAAAGSTDKSVVVRDETEGYTYAAPILNNSHSNPLSRESAPFIVVKAPYGTSEYYYRLAFAESKNGVKKAFDLLPNTKYEFEIMNVTAPGYATEEEACRGVNSTSVEYIINDTQPTIFRMASDGTRELGVTDKIEDPLGDEHEADFYVKCFPAPRSLNELRIKSDVDWVVVRPIPEQIKTIIEPDGQEGVLYRYKAQLLTNRQGSLREGSIKVSWDILSAAIPVYQDRSFIADRHTDVKLYINNGRFYYHLIKDYWTFIKGEGKDSDYGDWHDPEASPAPKLHGIEAEANGGRIRTQGLHFPVGSQEHNYRYELLPHFSSDIEVVSYRLSLAADSKFNGRLDFPTYDLDINETAQISFNKGWSQEEMWEPIVETDCFTVSAIDVSGNVVANLVMDIYYTGLFSWSENSNNRADFDGRDIIRWAWYYYEVVPVTINGHTVYWLDRNLGARAAGFDVIEHDGESVFLNDEVYPYLSGDGRSAGGLYHSVAEEGYYYNDPQMKGCYYPDYFGISGFMIPSMSDFNELRNSRNFVTTKETTPSKLVTYYNSYYRTPEGRRLYFPKVGQMQNDVRTSDGGTGHYWTSTAAIGFEKEEIGKWLSSFVITAGSEFFSRARINNPKTAMSVRLRNYEYNQEEFYQTHLKVKGATHVFLYRDNGGNREWVTPWPGTAICTPDNAFDELRNFVYESSRDVEFMAIFNFVEPSGKITTMAAENPEKGASATGWKAEGEFEFNLAHRRVN